MTRNTRKLHVRGSLDELAKCMSVVDEGARRAGLLARRRESLQFACREGYLAIVECCQTRGQRGVLEMEVSWDDASITVSLHHTGNRLDSLFDQIPLDQRLESMHRCVDELRYICGTRFGNQLSLVLRLLPREAARCRSLANTPPPRARAAR